MSRLLVARKEALVVFSKKRAARNCNRKPLSFFRCCSCLVADRHRHRRRPQQQRQRLDFLVPSHPSYLLQQQKRGFITEWLPEVITQTSVWGGSGYLLKTIHANTGLPYWACFTAISIGVRTALFPLVLYAAHTASKFAKIAPDIQFQIALFQRDLQHYRQMNATLGQKMFLLRTNITTLSSTYKLHNINPFTIFLSPLLQMPIFWYISIDLRKIVNGLDPQLAQNLVESGVGWIPDLTEPDPWFGLPVVAGALLYLNMEIALGKRSMAGETASKADTSVMLKDLFQSLAVFMPCFTSQLAGGVQVYIVTSFCFTLLQSAALRTETFRQIVGLPSMLAQKPTEGKFTSQMMELKKLEQKAREIRGDGPVLGKGVLMYGWQLSFPGSYRKSTIKGSDPKTLQASEPLVPFPIQAATTPKEVVGIRNLAAQAQQGLDAASGVPPTAATMGQYIHGISAPPWQLAKQQQQVFGGSGEEQQQTGISMSNNESPPNPKNDDDDNRREYMPQYSDEIMEKANRGELPREVQYVVEEPNNDVDDKAEKPTATTKKKGPPGNNKLNVTRLQRKQKGSSRRNKRRK